MEIAICAIVKNENLYLKEWVEYHKSIGISAIHIYDNNDVEHIEDVIQDYIDNGYVTVHDVRGKEKGLVYDSEYINLQPHCYIEFYTAYSDRFDWICFIDVDEFIVTENIQEFLSQSRFDKFDVVLANWKTFDDNDYVVRQEMNVRDTYSRMSLCKKSGVKSFVRTKKEIYDKHIKNLIHTFRTKGDRICFADGSQVVLTNKSNWYEPRHGEEFDCYIAHYKTKSLDEFLKRHLGRHWGTYTMYISKALSFDECIDRYFTYNSHTYLKDAYIDMYRTGMKDKILYKNLFEDIQSQCDRANYVQTDSRIILPNDIYAYDTLLLREYSKERVGYDMCPKIIKTFDNSHEADLSISNGFVIKCNVCHNDCIRFRYVGERHTYDIYEKMNSWKANKMTRYVKFSYYIEELIPNMTPEFVVRCKDNSVMSIRPLNIPNKEPTLKHKMSTLAIRLANGNIGDICFYEYNGKLYLKWVKLNNLIHFDTMQKNH